MKKYEIVAYVNGIESNTKTFKTLKDAKINFPTKKEIKNKMNWENRLDNQI